MQDKVLSLADKLLSCLRQQADSQIEGVAAQPFKLLRRFGQLLTIRQSLQSLVNRTQLMSYPFQSLDKFVIIPFTQCPVVSLGACGVRQ